jgi:hypothetical protein
MMAGKEIEVQLGPMLLTGYAEAVDYHVAKTGIDEFTVNIIVDFHMPEPIGALRRCFPFVVIGLETREALGAFVDEAIEKYNAGEDAERLK